MNAIVKQIRAKQRSGGKSDGGTNREPDYHLGSQSYQSSRPSSQVPLQNVYWTEGPSRTIRIGGQTVTFKHVAPSKMIGAGLIYSGRWLARQKSSPTARSYCPDLAQHVLNQISA